MNPKILFATVLVVLVAVFAGGAQLYRAHQDQQDVASAERNRETLVRFHSPRLGRAEARVHIVEFFDPACETCAAFFPMVKALMAQHREDIQLTLRYAPFHPGSEEVVKALEASRKQGRFWQALEALVAAQSSWTLNHQARVDLIWPHLERAGLDTGRLKADMQSPEIARNIAQDVADARALNVTKTPEFFVNGRPLPSFGFQQLRSLVDEELAATAKGKSAQP
jgi:protein-disulfide isomerase